MLMCLVHFRAVVVARVQHDVVACRLWTYMAIITSQEKRAYTLFGPCELIVSKLSGRPGAKKGKRASKTVMRCEAPLSYHLYTQITK